MALTIKTNRIPRDVLRWHDLTPKERAEFDYLDTEERQDEASFMRYRNWTYDLGEFMRCPADSSPAPDSLGFSGWDGYHSDSYFSGILIRYPDSDCEQVIAATYYS
jgi:hypothetical protein